MPSSPLRMVAAADVTAPAACPELPPLTYTAKELARELRTSVKTIRRLDQSGRLPRGIKIGHGRRWPRQTIVRWIAAGCPRRTEWEKFHA